ncbi:TetR/AcrR family transcriptional regulator [Nocardia sp. NBC_00508]|uniref:TetR/AcrR family transcriptional regulator n=1 Tax=Nocardia sp. NBC_00508 TaxID=2975992 RepID=UPI002E817437|nr:TetR/AcrR family transcriptional regulator [Nocardia sp. NBC_00508]WUD66278.1 TetR/AcrR family transcriptional regulator [Nocardia sp. NBC_00508]
MTDAEDRPRANETRSRLLDAAAIAFAQRGFHGSTTRDITSIAGLSTAAIYVHHRSKEELLYQISKTGHQATLDLVRTAIGSAEDPTDQLIAVMHDFAEHHAKAHVIARVVNYELAALDAPHQQEIKDLRRDIHDELRSLIADGVETGVFNTPDPHMAATALLSLGVDIARWYHEDGSWSPEDIADFYADLALRIVGARRPSGTTSP